MTLLGQNTMRKYTNQELAAKLKKLIRQASGTVSGSSDGSATISQNGQTVKIPPGSQSGIGRTTTNR
jgi:hypothetical protein